VYDMVTNCISAQLVFSPILGFGWTRKYSDFYYDPLYGHMVVCRTLDKIIFYCPDPFWKVKQIMNWDFSVQTTAPSLTVLKHTDIKNSTHLMWSFVTLNQRFEAFDQLYFRILNVETVQGSVFQNVWSSIQSYIL